MERFFVIHQPENSLGVVYGLTIERQDGHWEISIFGSM